MADTLLALGHPAFIFSVSSAAFDALKRSTAWNWPSVARLGQLPARQFTGKGEDSITISGTIITEVSGLGQIDRLRVLADRGEPQFLLAADGRVLGRWVIERIEEEQRYFLPDGSPRKQSFSLTLSAYGEDA